MDVNYIPVQKKMHIHISNVYSVLFSKNGVLICRLKDICGSNITETPKSSVSHRAAPRTFWMGYFLIVGGSPVHCRLFNCISASPY